MKKHNKEPQKPTDQQYEIGRVKVSDQLLPFSMLHRVKKKSLQIIWTIIISILFAFFGIIFIQNTGLYGFGVDAISHGGARFISFLIQYNNGSKEAARIVFVVLFWFINFAINIPLFIFAAKKINRNFALLTFIFMLFSTAFGIVFGLIPGSEKLNLFGRPLNDFIYRNTDGIVQTAIWSFLGDANKHVAIVLYGLLWAIIQGAIAAALLILNSSTAGFDILVVWYSREKFKNLGIVYIIFHIISLIISNFIGTYLPASLTIQKNLASLPSGWEVAPWSTELLFNPSFASSFLMILINGLIVDVLFPKYKLVKLEIYTSKIEEIQKAIYSLKDKRFTTSTAIVRGGYSKKEQTVLVANCFYVDAATVVEITTKEDPDAFISIYDTKKTLGHVYISKSIN
ncbi:Uncharacterised protein [Metamycoplasma arthritidis]|uniref:DUF2179 domain-containing protein n=1 Tax=Metamycoplasma arthritidis (strain 158L3-1) TaxID=243272 RepID=B3PM41_META1|nr:DUF2179 domain-containing protein [Metamycoplasma arthritidis]ACF07093.1 conserved hypothetical protein [Metamycoplasma arthritidis 158L3-1]VEU78621.1 Uncharacterised protein [Metamycoplasma arthritidis]